LSLSGSLLPTWGPYILLSFFFLRISVLMTFPGPCSQTFAGGLPHLSVAVV
jgi:hypothetical protein